MKVHVSYTVEVREEYRRAVRAYYGKDGLATRKELQRWFAWYGHSNDDDLMHEYRIQQEQEAALNERKAANQGNQA